jgi:hypothetical protein
MGTAETGYAKLADGNVELTLRILDFDLADAWKWGAMVGVLD